MTALSAGRLWTSRARVQLALGYPWIAEKKSVRTSGGHDSQTMTGEGRLIGGNRSAAGLLAACKCLTASKEYLLAAALGPSCLHRVVGGTPQTLSISARPTQCPSLARYLVPPRQPHREQSGSSIFGKPSCLQRVSGGLPQTRSRAA